MRTWAFGVGGGRIQKIVTPSSAPVLFWGDVWISCLVFLFVGLVSRVWSMKFEG